MFTKYLDDEMYLIYIYMLTYFKNVLNFFWIERKVEKKEKKDNLELSTFYYIHVLTSLDILL